MCVQLPVRQYEQQAQKEVVEEGMILRDAKMFAPRRIVIHSEWNYGLRIAYE